jgi:hypothetical protein
LAFDDCYLSGIDIEGFPTNDSQHLLLLLLLVQLLSINVFIVHGHVGIRFIQGGNRVKATSDLLAGGRSDCEDEWLEKSLLRSLLLLKDIPDQTRCQILILLQGIHLLLLVVLS